MVRSKWPLRLIAQTFKMHFDLAGILIIKGPVGKMRDVEIAAKPMVQMGQDVQVELGGEAICIIIGGLQGLAVLVPVYAQKKIIPGRHSILDPGQKCQTLRVSEIAKGGAKENKHARLCRRCMQGVQGLFVGAGKAPDGQGIKTRNQIM